MIWRALVNPSFDVEKVFTHADHFHGVGAAVNPHQVTFGDNDEVTITHRTASHKFLDGFAIQLAPDLLGPMDLEVLVPVFVNIVVA